MELTILKKPVITEKYTKQGETLNKYAFIVDKRANKLEIKTAIEEMYDVEIESVNTMIFTGKNRIRMTKTGIQKGRTASYKKAVVTLKKGDKIDFYSNI
jgi:large subunit ribosomal protein L23